MHKAVIPRWVSVILVLSSGSLLVGSCMTHDARQAVLEAAFVDPWDDAIPLCVNDCLNPCDGTSWQPFVDAFYGAMATISEETIDYYNPTDRPPM